MSQRNKIETLIFSNPFDLEDFEHISVDAEDRTLKDLLYGVNTDLDLSVQLNGVDVDEKDYGTIVPKAGEVLAILLVPGGGDDDNTLKTVLRIVATVVVAYFTGYYMGEGMYFAAAAVSVGGNLAINALLPIEPPSMESEGMGSGESPTYGIDGPKNTSREGIPVPITFGKNRVAGNIISLYTDNRGTQQYLYMLVNAGEGPVYDINNIKFNDIDAEAFNPTITKRLGKPNQAEAPGFESVNEVKNIGFTFKDEHDSYTFETNSNANRLDLSINVPRLYDLQDNKTVAATVKMKLMMRPLGSGESWQYVQTGGREGDVDYLNENSDYSISASDYNFYPKSVEKVEEGLVYEAICDIREYESFEFHGHGEDVAENSRIHERDLEYRSSREPRGRPNRRRVTPRTVVTGVNKQTGEREEVGQFAGSRKPYGISANSHSAGYHIFRRKVMAPYRYNISSRPVKPNRYELQVDRLSAAIKDEDNNPLPSDWQLTDINEIMPYGVSYRNTALLGIEVLVTDQLTRIPTVTFDHEGTVIDTYDAETGKWVKEPSDNPAWIAYNVYTNRRWGGRYKHSQMDLPSYIKWARVCEENGWKFNGTFDTDGNIFDSLKAVFKVGHARRVMHGDLFSVSIINPKRPTMLFNESNIASGSLSISWSGNEDRANEIDVIFYDRENNYRRSEFKLYDQTAFERGEDPRPTQLTLHGVVDYQQAYNEGMFALNMNRIGQSVSFKSTLEGKDVQIGDVVYVQHPMPRWSEGGRVKESESLTSITLDRVIELEDAEYEVMIQFPSLKMGSYDIESKGGNKFYLGMEADRRISQIIYDGQEYIVMGFLDEVTVQVDREIVGTGTVIEAYAKDVVQSRKVSTVAGTHDTIELESELPSSPEGLAWSIGKVEYAKKSFLITSVKSSDVYEYEISGMEYIPELMTSDEVGPLPDYAPPIEEDIKPVQDISFQVDMKGQGSLRKLVLTAFWSYPANNLHQKADVWISINDEDLRLHQSRAGTYSEIEVEHLDRVKVVVCARKGNIVQDTEQSSFGSILIEHNTAPEKPDEFDVALFQNTAVLSWADAKNDIGEDIVGHYRVLRRSAGFLRDSDGTPMTPAPVFSFDENGKVPDGFDQIAKTTQTYYVDEPIQTNTYYDYVVIPADISGAENEVEPVHQLLTTPAEFDLRSKEGIEVMYFTGSSDFTLAMAGTPDSKPELWSKSTVDAKKFQATRYHRLGVSTPWVITVLFDSIDSISDEVIQQVNDSIKNVNETIDRVDEKVQGIEDEFQTLEGRVGKKVEGFEGELQTLEEQYDDRLERISGSAFKSESELDKILQQNLMDIVERGGSKRSDAKHSYEIHRISSEVKDNGKTVQSEIVRIDETIATEKQASASARESIVSQVENETSQRRSAINNVSESLTSESETRATQYNQLQSSVSTEETQRKAAVNSLTESISSEASTRATQYNNLETAITTEKGSRESAINQLNEAISDESSSRASQYNSLSAAITTEKGERKSAIDSVSESITSESESRATQYNQLQSSINTEETQRKAAVNSLSESIASEASTRATQYNNLETAINTETSNRKSAVSQLNEAISNETSARATQYNNLDTAISTEKTERVSAISQVNQAISSETQTRTTQYNSLDSAITTEKSERKSAISQVNQAISNEATTRSQALSQLESSLNSNISSSITENNRTMVGYCWKGGNVTSHETPTSCEAAGGVWRAASPFAESLKAAELTDGSGNTIQALSYFRALEDDTGELMARSFVGVNADGVLTGIHVDGSSTRSKIRLAAEELEVYSASRNMSPITWDGAEMVIRGHLKSSTFESGTITGGVITGSSFTGGYYRTASPSYSGNRTVVGGGSNYALWSGQGSQTDGNAVFYVKKSGGAVFKGDLVGGNITGATLSGVDGEFSGTVRAEKIIGEQSSGGVVQIPHGEYVIEEPHHYRPSQIEVFQINVDSFSEDRVITVGSIGFVGHGSYNAAVFEWHTATGSESNFSKVEEDFPSLMRSEGYGENRGAGKQVSFVIPKNEKFFVKFLIRRFANDNDYSFHVYEQSVQYTVFKKSELTSVTMKPSSYDLYG